MLKSSILGMGRNYARANILGVVRSLNLAENVPTIVSIWANVTRPTARLNRPGPLRADEHVRAVDLVNRAVTGPLVLNTLLLAADAYQERLAFEPRDCMHTRNRH